jgi:predicted transposase/invertase (TIGR01784 family)
MFDNLCKFLAENFSEDYATWLLGRPVTLTKLSPTELSLEPIRADSLILEQSEDLVLHLEFQTEPDETMGFRMLDYRVRVYRRFPSKTMHQVVIYLKPTKSASVYQDSFQVGKTIHRYRVIRLWEQSSEVLLKKGGLLPLAILTKSEEQIIRLREVAKELDKIENQGMRANLMAATAVFAGLVMEPEMIKTILRSDIMKESAFYQEILQEGRQESLQKGRLEGKLEVARRLLQLEMSLSQVAQVTGLSEQELQQSLSD